MLLDLRRDELGLVHGLRASVKNWATLHAAPSVQTELGGLDLAALLRALLHGLHEDDGLERPRFRKWIRRSAQSSSGSAYRAPLRFF